MINHCIVIGMMGTAALRLLTKSWILAVTIGALLAGLPCMRRTLRRQRYDRLMALQLRQSLQSMVHSLQVGTGFLQALERTSKEGEQPLAREWATVLQSVRLGTPLRQALDDLGRRVPLKEMAWFITTAQITQETGGSLAGVLATLVATLQERETFRDKVAALTAQGRASGVLLSALPFLLMAALYVIAPEFIRPLFRTQAGQTMLAGVIVMVAAGGLVIFKIVSIQAE